MTTFISLPSVVCAQEGSSETDATDAAARAEFERGRSAYDSGQWGNALDAFERAYELSGRPQLLYNIALSHDRLRHDEEALEYYERFLERIEDPPEETQVQARIRALRIAVAEQSAREQELVAQAMEEEVEEPEESSSPTAAIVGVTVALVVVSAAVGVLVWNGNRDPDVGDLSGNFGNHSMAIRFGR